VCVCKLLTAVVALVVPAVAAAAAAAKGADVIKVGLVFQQVYVPGKHHTN
jgi:hypothetical protein